MTDTHNNSSTNISTKYDSSPINVRFVRRGKVRDVIEINNHMIGLIHTDRLSAFDRHICNIPGKGNLLLNTSLWWMENTRHIVPNHVLWHYENVLFCKKAKVIPIEFVVRGYITGSTNTSLWTHYNNGERTYCGIDFPDGLVKNQRLEEPVITPTTKDEHDEPLSLQDIVTRGVLTPVQLNYISEVAMRLFKYGQQVAAERGLILVDTKYEFGFDEKGQIILIDEIHTCDSSRYWKLDTYQERFNNGQEPQKLDKDAARCYVKTLCDPYTVEQIPTIPNDKIESVYQCYNELYHQLTQNDIERFVFNPDNYINIPEEHTHHTNFHLQLPEQTNEENRFIKMIQHYYKYIHSELVVIVAGSEKDAPHINKLKRFLSERGIQYHNHVASAHKQTRAVLDLLDMYNNSVQNYSFQHKLSKYRRSCNNSRKIIFITVAGRSNALSGVVACNTQCPVIACPPFKDKMDMMVNINSTLQMPSNTPVLTILEPINVVLACQRMFNM